MTAEMPMTLGAMSFEGDVDCSQGRVGNEMGGNFVKVIYLPKAGTAPLVGKILPDFRASNRANFPIEFHEFSVGSAITDMRFFMSPKCFGQEDLLTNLFWKSIKERKVMFDNLLAKHGDKESAKTAAKENKEYCNLELAVKMTRPKKGALLYWVGKGESKVQTLMIKEQMADILFGAPAKKDFSGKDVPPIPGLVKEMREMNLSPFNLHDACGWVKLFKTGTGPTTQFHAEMEQMKREVIAANGRRQFFLEPTEGAVDAAILNVDPNTIPPFASTCEELSWTVDEMKLYIESEFTEIPKRYYKKTGGSNIPHPSARKTEPAFHGQSLANAVDAAYEAGDAASESDIPF
jgi:hypothetical protein